MPNVPSDANYNDFSPVGGEVFDLSGSATLTIDTSTEDIGGVYCNGVFQALLLRNTSTTTPNIVNFSGFLQGSSGTVEMDGLKILLGTADGVTPNITYTLPVDSRGQRPTVLGSLLVAGTLRYTQLPDFTDIHNDHRGLHFTYDSTTGAIVFGDGTNGQIPSGTVECNNIFVESNGQTVNFSNQGRLVGAGNTTWIRPDMSPGLLVALDPGANWCVVDCTSSLTLDIFKLHEWADWDYIGVDSSINTRLTLARNVSTDSLVFQTRSTASTEVLQNANLPLNGVVEARFVEQISSTFARVRFYNNGGDVTVRSFGGFSASFAARGGIGGTFRIKWSDGYKIGDTSPYAQLLGLFDGDLKVPDIDFIGALNWSGEREAVMTLQAGKWEIGSPDKDIIIPAGVALDEIVTLGGTSQGTLNRLVFNGTANSGTRDINTFAPNGWRISNLRAPNETDMGNQAEDNTELQFTHTIGQNLASSRGMDSSTVYTVADRTQGAHWFKPHPDGPNARFVSGTEDDIRYVGNKLYLSAGTILETRSNVLSAYGPPTLLSILGYLTSNFSVKYKLWAVTGSEPVAFKDYTTANAQADYTAAGLSINSADSYVLIRLEKLTGAIDQGYITGLKMEVPLDPAYIWSPPGAEVSFTMPNILNGSQFLVWNTTANQIAATGFATATGVEATFTEGVDFDDGDSGQVWVAYQAGTTVMEKVRVDFTFGTSDISIPTVQQLLTEFNTANGFIDGSTVSWLGLDPADPHILQFDASTSGLPLDANGNALASKWAMVSWYYFAIAHDPIGIQLFFDEMDVIDGSNVIMNNGVKLDNIGDRMIYFTDSEKNLFTADGTSWSSGVHTGGYGIVSVNKIPTTITTTSPLTPAQESSIALIPAVNTTVADTNSDLEAVATAVQAIPTDTASDASIRAELAPELAYLDAAISSRGSDEDLTAVKAKTDELTYTVPGKVDSNLQYVTGQPVDGAGTEDDPWGPSGG